MTSSLSRKGQVTIPIHIRKLLGLSPHAKVAFVVIDGRVELLPAQSVTERTAGALRQYRHTPAPSPADERAAFEQAIADEVASDQRD